MGEVLANSCTLRLLMELNMHRGGSRSEPTLVLLHGIGSRWGIWEPVLGPLEERFDVIALDLPGFGASPMPPAGTPAGPASLCELVLTSLREMGVEEFHVAGNSLGGLLALDLARRGVVRSSCAISPAGFAGRAETLLAKGLLAGAIHLARALAPYADRVLSRPRARTLLLNTFYGHPSRVPARAAAEDMRQMAAAPWFDATLPTIERWNFPHADDTDAPTTIAWGDKDRLLLPRQARQARADLPHARIVPLPGCGHLPTWDDPELVARVMIEATSRA
jgi:pimeloyl-ACP methyl ester carboxylesterase